ncbi:hypothetical protein ACIBI0_38705 [Microbispora rosea]|uniref:hypothetical protein n=1 Tax=Microbispora rosea TaxID=58117 RepID=UPI003798682A
MNQRSRELCDRIAALKLSPGDMASVLGTMSVLAPDALDKALDALVLERLGDHP